MIRSFEKRAEQKISGFQSPAADYLEGRLDISGRIVIDPHSTFYVQMEGNAMSSFGIQNADILIIDKSVKPVEGTFIIAFVNGNFTCRLYCLNNGLPSLKNDEDTISETELGTLQIWGTVTSLCRNVLPSALRTGRYNNVCTL